MKYKAFERTPYRGAKFFCSAKLERNDRSFDTRIRAQINKQFRLRHLLHLHRLLQYTYQRKLASMEVSIDASTKALVCYKMKIRKKRGGGKKIRHSQSTRCLGK